MASETSPVDEQAQPQWRPLKAMDRRVAGVLIEKAKTTPDAYPLSLSAVRTGSNQKSNRHPAMQLTEEEAEDSLERLREMGAVTAVQGSGRVDRFRHEMYRWLGVDKVELAVMAELLLRGAQTLGELRGRAARMDAIADLSALRPLVASLKSKGLVIALNREGRGHVVTHALYQPAELEQLKAQFGDVPDEPDRSVGAIEQRPPEAPSTGTTAAAASPSDTFAPARQDVGSMHNEQQWARTQIAQLREDLDDLRTQHERTMEELRELKEALGV